MYCRLFVRTHYLLGQNIIEKIASSHSVDKGVYCSGDFIEFVPDYLMTHDNTSAVLNKWEQNRLQKVHKPDQLKFIMDHDIQNMTKSNLDKYAKIKKFAQEQGVGYYAPGRGIGHQVMCEEGFIAPGSMVVASDSHSNMYGALGCLGTPVVRTDAAKIWETGKTWWQIPPVVLVEFKNKLNPGVHAKDVILALISNYPNEVLNCAVEFRGHEVFTIEERMTIANMTTEWGCAVGIFPGDHATHDWIMDNSMRIKHYDNYAEEAGNMLYNDLWNNIRYTESDNDAEYHARIELDLSSVRPTITGPDDPGTVAYRTDNEHHINIDKGFILSCVNARYDDLRIASNLLTGRKLNAELYIAAASDKVEQDARITGVWTVFQKAGANFLPPGCGPCIGMGAGILKDGEVAISATNRNYKGRMGSKNSRCYLASPATVIKACIDGYITLPRKTDLVTSIQLFTTEKTGSVNESILDNISAHVVCLDRCNISTDLIYAGKYTYKDLTLEEQADVVFENYGTKIELPDFPHKFIIVAGANFGTGSSREQAVTALQARGCVAVIAPSFNNTYLRNAFNNGLVCITMNNALDNISNFADLCCNTYVDIDFKNSVVSAGQVKYKFDPISIVGQRLVKAGGIKLGQAE